MNFGGLTFQNSSEANMTVFSAQISGNVTGSIAVGKVRRLVAGGSISASIRGINDLVDHSPSTGNDYAVGRVQAASITSAGQVRSAVSGGAANAGIYRVQLSGNLNAPVFADDGRIGIIDVGGDIDINNASNIHARDDLDSVEANTINMHSGSIQVTGTSTYGIGRIKTRTGNFTGGIISPRLRNNVTDPGLLISGTLAGNVSIGTPGSFGNVLSPISVGTMATTASITVSGDIRANVTATTGSLPKLLVTGGLGVAGTPITVTAPGAIGQIQALSATASVTSTTAGAGVVSVTASWTGSLNVASVTSLSVGNWSGGECRIRNQVPVGQDIVMSGVSSTGSIALPGGLAGQVLIDNSLLGGISLPASGLVGQVVINRANAGGTWNGSASVDSISLTPLPYYDAASSTLGGGSIGLARFSIHYEDCTPAGAAATLTCGNSNASIQPDPSAVILSHYGPVTFSADTAGIGFTVKKRKHGQCTWTDVTSSFSSTLHPGGNERNVEIDGPFSSASGVSYEYLIEPVTSGTGLKKPLCEGVTGTPPVYDYDYLLLVIAPDIGRFDFNHDEQFDEADLMEWANAPRDLDGDDAVDGSDAAMLVDAYARRED